MMTGRIKEETAGCCCILGALTLVITLSAAYAFVVPVVVTVDDAALTRLDLAAAPAPDGNNGTVPSLAINLSLAVAVRNRNWAMSAWLPAPPVGELRFRGVPFARGWLPVAPRAWRPHRIRARRTEMYRVSSEIEGVLMAGLGSDGVDEFARESAAGVFQLELVVSGEVRYQAHLHRRNFSASCPLKLSLSTGAFARVRCT